MAARPRSTPARPRVESLSADQARRLVLSAQGLAGPLPARVTARTLRTVLSRLGAIQIDAINVVARSHELVLAARTGETATALFDRVVYRDRVAVEAWAHAASFVPVEHFRLLLPRMRRRAEERRPFRETHAEVYTAVLARIRAEGPLAASDFKEPGGARRGPWWDWTPAKRALADLFLQGVLLVHDRVRFEQRYDLAERVLPPGLDLSEPTMHESSVGLVLAAAKALGVATLADLADHFRIRADSARDAVADLVGAGVLQRVEVEGWERPGHLVAGTRLPRRAEFPPTLLSPFDSLVWASQTGARERTLRLFGFNYVLEIYLPQERRRWGYYTMPVLAGGRLVARVDPKLDRAGGRLLLRAVHLEPGVDRDEALAAVEAAGARLARALGAETVEASPPA